MKNGFLIALIPVACLTSSAPPSRGAGAVQTAVADMREAKEDAAPPAFNAIGATILALEALRSDGSFRDVVVPWFYWFSTIGGESLGRGNGHVEIVEETVGVYGPPLRRTVA